MKRQFMQTASGLPWGCCGSYRCICNTGESTPQQKLKQARKDYAPIIETSQVPDHLLERLG
jgi:hypothetical protein